jgi:hypothetical protein
MNQVFRPRHIGAAAVVIGGVLIGVLPHHAMSIVRLVIVTVAAAAGLYALTASAPPMWWLSPFDRNFSRRKKSRGSDDIESIRSKLASPRRRLAQLPPLPPESLHLLRPLIVAALEREGIDPADEASARPLVSPLTWAVLENQALQRGQWIPLLPNQRETARVVHRVLDDLDRLAGNNAPATSSRHARHGAT